MPLSNVDSLQKLKVCSGIPYTKYTKIRLSPNCLNAKKEKRKKSDYIKIYGHIIPSIIRNNETCVFPCRHAWSESAEHKSSFFSPSLPVPSDTQIKIYKPGPRLVLNFIKIFREA